MCALSGLTTGNYEGQIHVFFIIFSASTLSVIYLNDLNHQKSQCHQYLVGIFLKTYRPIYISSPICFVATSKHKKGQIVRMICILITFKRCTLKVSRIKGSRFKVSRLSFSPDSRDGFLYPGRYEIWLGCFDPHDCTPNNRDAMNKLCTHTNYHKGTLVYTHVLICQNSFGK